MASPVLIPRFGENATPPDLVNALFILVAAAALWHSRESFRFPLGASYLLIVIGGTLAIPQSIVPLKSVAAIAQDVYLYVWFALIVNVIVARGERAARLVACLWAFVGVMIGTLSWVVSLLGVSAPTPFGIEMISSFGRVSATFRDPNLAANFMAVSFFVLWAAPRPRSVTMKLAWSVPIVLGVLSTDSITGLATMAGGTIVALTLTFVPRRAAAGVVSLILIAGALAALAAIPDKIAQVPGETVRTLGETETFVESLGRTDSSLGPRIERWREAFALFGDDLWIGIGPASWNDTSASVGTIGGELHNDFVAGVLERGVSGGLGVLLIFFGGIFWTLRIARASDLRSRNWRPPAFAGGAVVIFLGAMSLETLHFRHVWMFFALVIGLALSRAGESKQDLPAARAPAVSQHSAAAT